MEGQVKRILIVEDESATATALQRVLRERKFLVEIATTAQAAREKLVASNFDLLVLDLILPDEHGLSLLNELHAAQPALPVMILSNVSLPESLKEAKRYGVCDYVVKAHISLHDLGEKVVEVIVNGRCSQPFSSVK